MPTGHIQPVSETELKKEAESVSGEYLLDSSGCFRDIPAKIHVHWGLPGDIKAREPSALSKLPSHLACHMSWPKVQHCSCVPTWLHPFQLSSSQASQDACKGRFLSFQTYTFCIVPQRVLLETRGGNRFLSYVFPTFFIFLLQIKPSACFSQAPQTSEDFRTIFVSTDAYQRTTETPWNAKIIALHLM